MILECYMFGKKIIVIGGSIAGCTSAILLRRLGANVIILERSAGLIAKGSGITLPEIVVNQCIALDLFDSNISRLNISSRSFIRKNDLAEHASEAFWKQPVRVMALNWADVYQNLRKRISPEFYYTNTEVCRIEPMSDGYHLETTTGVTYQADLVIAADGVDSIARTFLLPDVFPEYSGYVAWRGILDEQILAQQAIFDEHVPYYVFPNGHLLLYRIPARDFQQTGHTLLNWVMYENRHELPLNDFLIDNQGKQHTRSLPAGSLTERHIQYLRELSEHVLATDIGNIIVQTQQPFIQAVFDFQLPSYLSKHIIFVGDAAATLRPHTASGVFKALTNGLELSKLIESNPDKNLIEHVAMWKEAQQALLSADVQKAKNMGDALVTRPPNWGAMNQQLTEQWWAEVMQGKSWYATSI
jgi:2-polyprenyl-6-methoxyphenol hydroxylase-like FAD-dependent oxidoreductase